MAFNLFVMRVFLLFAAAAFLGGGAARAAEVVPATSYFPVLPIEASADAEPQYVPLAVNQLMSSNHKDVTRAIVVIHDEGRDAMAAAAIMTTLAGSLNASTIILAPQFLMPSDIVRFADYLPDQGKEFAAWQVLAWSWGDDSMPVGKRKSVSSFTVVDLLLMYLSDKETFPDLKEIVVAGYGAGANFVQRYAVFTGATDIVNNQDIIVRYLAAAPSSYLYVTNVRPMGGKSGFAPPNAAECPMINAYPYGLEKLNPYARRTGANAAKVDYSRRFLTYLYMQSPEPIPDLSCAAAAQGGSGLARAENFRLYLHTLYGDVVSRTQTFARAKGERNDAVTMFGSACGMAVLFGDGMCAPSEGGIR